MTPTPRTAALLGAIALLALALPVGVVALAGAALITGAAVDALSVRRAPALRRGLPSVLSRGIPAPLTVAPASDAPGRLRVRQAATPDLHVEPREADGTLQAMLTPRRRGRHVLPGVASRADGPLGLGRWHHRDGEPAELLVYPDLPAARRLALAVREGRFRDPGLRRRGALGLGTEFESIRDYLPDDDLRQVNWNATVRMGRPMSNQYRIEHDRDVLCVVDTGRLMTAPLGGDRTRLDEALDAVAAMALVADEVGDRCGALAFDTKVRRSLRPRRAGGTAVVRALFDLEPTFVDSDYELAFRTLRPAKRAFVLVLTDLLEETASGPLVEAVPVLARRHAVAIASVSDPDLTTLVGTPPQATGDVYTMAVALDVLQARTRAAALVRRAGADVIEAAPGRLGAVCVHAYLRAKTRARL